MHMRCVTNWGVRVAGNRPPVTAFVLQWYPVAHKRQVHRHTPFQPKQASRHVVSVQVQTLTPRAGMNILLYSTSSSGGMPVSGADSSVHSTVSSCIISKMVCHDLLVSAPNLALQERE